MIKRNSRTILLAGLVTLACAWELTADSVNFPCGTYIVAGTVKNENNKVVGSASSDDGIVMQAVAMNGTILAESQIVAESGSSGQNFLLEVPLTLRATSKSASVGDSVRIVMATNGQTLAVSPSPVPLTHANAYTNLTLQLYEVYEYANPSNKAEVLKIPKAYVDSLASRLDGKAYDPFADYDGDGASNYYEFLCGTDPFLANDRLRIRDFSHGGPRVALKFEYTGGIVYGVSASPSLTRPAWSAEPVATDAAKTPEDRQVLINASAGDVGETTLYMLPTADAKSMFYRLEVK